MQVAFNAERWNALFSMATIENCIHCSSWRTLCFEEDIVQSLSHIADTWVY